MYMYIWWSHTSKATKVQYILCTALRAYKSIWCLIQWAVVYFDISCHVLDVVLVQEELVQDTEHSNAPSLLIIQSCFDVIGMAWSWTKLLMTPLIVHYVIYKHLSRAQCFSVLVKHTLHLPVYLYLYLQLYFWNILRQWIPGRADRGLSSSCLLCCTSNQTLLELRDKNNQSEI